MRFHFFSLVYPDQKNEAKNLAKSLARFGHALVTIPTYDPVLKNLSKIIKVQEFLASQKFADNDLICLLDGFDVLCTKNPDALPDFLRNKSLDILLGTENMFGAHAEETRPFFDQLNVQNKSIGKYLNSGVIVGFAKPLCCLYQEMSNFFWTIRNRMPPQKWTSDQVFMSIFLGNLRANSPYRIGYDFHDEIIFNDTAKERKYQLGDHVFVHIWGQQWSQRQRTKYFHTASRVLR